MLGSAGAGNVILTRYAKALNDAEIQLKLIAYSTDILMKFDQTKCSYLFTLHAKSISPPPPTQNLCLNGFPIHPVPQKNTKCNYDSMKKSHECTTNKVRVNREC